LRQDPVPSAESPTVTDDTPPRTWYHGTRIALRSGELLTAGRPSNYIPDVVMNHVYFTALIEGAGLAAEVAVMLADGVGTPHVYEVEPTGPFEDDPNVTDKKFPGNPTRSYRSRAPLRVVREIDDWPRLSPEALEQWRERLAVLLTGGPGIILN
jgi:hypothetical protein